MNWFFSRFFFPGRNSLSKILKIKVNYRLCHVWEFFCIYAFMFFRLCQWSFYIWIHLTSWIIIVFNNTVIIDYNLKKNDLYSFVQIRTNWFWKQCHEDTLNDHRLGPKRKENYGKEGALPLVPLNPSLGTISRTILLCGTFVAWEAISKTAKTNPCRVLEIKLTTLCYNQMKIIMYCSLLLSRVKWISSARILN